MSDLSSFRRLGHRPSHITILVLARTMMRLRIILWRVSRTPTLKMVNPATRAFFDLPGTGEYDQEERHIRGASEEPLESSSTHPLNPGSSYRYPTSSQSTLESIIKWTRGPDIPRAYHIQSSRWLQVARSRIIDEYLPNRRLRICALLILYLSWDLESWDSMKW